MRLGSLRVNTKRFGSVNARSGKWRGRQTVFMCLPRLPICIKIESTHLDEAIPMTDETDPDKLKGPGGLTLRQIHEQVQKSVERDRQEQASRNTIATQRTRWQRWVRYVWGRSGRR